MPVNSRIEEIYRKKTVTDGSGKVLNPFPTSISYDEGAAIYAFLRRLKPQKTLEIGMAYGLSTLFICQSLVDNGSGEHTAIDPRQSGEWRSIGIENLKSAGLRRVCRVLEEDSASALPRLAASEERFDFIFIDGVHHFDNALVDFFYSDRILKQNGYIMLHDCWMAAIAKLRRYILANRDYQEVCAKEWERLTIQERAARKLRRLKTNCRKGWTANYCILRKTGNSERDWDYFRDF